MATIGKNLVEVGVSMVLRDEFSTNAGRISDSYSRLLNDMNTYNRGISMSVGKAFEVGTQMIGGMYEAYRHSSEVYDQIFLTSKIAGATAKQQQELLRLAQEVNVRTPLSNIDIGSGMKYLAMAGNSADAIKEMIGPAAELASIFGMELGGKGGVADMMTNIMATFGIASDDARKTADILGKATTSANISLTDLAQSLQYSGATFRNAGVDLKVASAAIGVLGDQGIQASSAGTALANMLRYLTLSITGQKAKGTDMLKALGIHKDDLVDSYGNLKRLDEIMVVMARHMQGLSGTAREQAMYNIFGVRGQRAAAALMQDVWSGNNKFSSILSGLDRAGGFTESTTDERLRTSMGIIEMFRSTFDNLVTTFGTNIAPVFGGVIKLLTSAISGLTNFISSGFGKWATLYATIGIGIGTIINGTKLIWRTMKMVVTSVQMASTGTQGVAGGLTRANTSAAMLEGHLRTIVALLIQSSALSMAPGGKGTLPGGYVYGRNKAGGVYGYIPSGKKGVRGKTYNAGNFAERYKPFGAQAPTPGAGVGAGSGARMGKWAALGKGVGKLAGGALSLLGGWWGIGITVGLGLLTAAINRNKESTDDNTSAVNKNTDSMSASEFRSYYEDKFINAVKSVMSNNNKDPMKLAISVNGGAYSVHNNGDILDVDTWGTY